MSNVRINALATTATSVASDDYLPLDGATNGTRKIFPRNLAAAVTASRIVNVDASGDDTNGNGTALAPFATLAAAIASITDATSVLPAVVKCGPGTQGDGTTALTVKPNVHLVASARGSVKLNYTGFTWANPVDVSPAIQYFSCTGFSFANAITINPNTTNYLGATSNSQMSFTDCLNLSATLNLDIGIPVLFANCFQASVTATMGAAYIDNCLSAAIYAGGAGNLAVLCVVTSSPEPFNVTVNGTNAELDIDAASLPNGQLQNVNVLNGGVLVSINSALGVGYVPGNAGDWSVVPAVVSDALDELAARPSGVAGTITLSSGAGTITNAQILATDVILLTKKTASGASTAPQITVSAGSAVVAGAGTDNGTYNWRVLH